MALPPDATLLSIEMFFRSESAIGNDNLPPGPSNVFAAIESGEVPTGQTWLDDLLIQWNWVRENVEEPTEFFAVEEHVARAHLNTLATILHSECSKDPALFQQDALKKLTAIQDDVRGICQEFAKQKASGARLPAEATDDAESSFADPSPGCTYSCFVKPYTQSIDRRKYFFDFGQVDGARFSAYITAENIFTIAIHDSHGEPYVIQILFCPEGLPISKWSHLVCQASVSVNSTIIRVVVDKRTVGLREVPFRVDIRSLRLTNGSIGADLTGENHGKFDAAGLKVFDHSISDAELNELFMEAEPRLDAE